MKHAYASLTVLCFIVFTFSITTYGRSSNATAAATNLTSSDLIYIEEMTQHHEDAVEMAKFSENKSKNNEIKTISQKITADQTREIAQLREWKKKWHNDKAVKAKMPKMDMNHLQTLQGEEFDKMFLKMMVEHHQGAITLSNDMMPKLKQQEIRNFAKNVIEKQESEIVKLNKIASKIQ